MKIINTILALVLSIGTAQSQLCNGKTEVFVKDCAYNLKAPFVIQGDHIDLPLRGLVNGDGEFSISIQCSTGQAYVEAEVMTTAVGHDSIYILEGPTPKVFNTATVRSPYSWHFQTAGTNTWGWSEGYYGQGGVSIRWQRRLSPTTLTFVERKDGIKIRKLRLAPIGGLQYCWFQDPPAVFSNPSQYYLGAKNTKCKSDAEIVKSYAECEYALKQLGKFADTTITRIDTFTTIPAGCSLTGPPYLNLNYGGLTLACCDENEDTQPVCKTQAPAPLVAAKDSESEVAKMRNDNNRLKQANEALRKALEAMTN